MAKDNEVVDQNTVYQEAYAEMRRFRDYEITASTWYITIQLALFGVLTLSNGKLPFQMRCIAIFLSMLIGVGGAYTVYYAHVRYKSLRDLVDNTLEPHWYNEMWKDIKRNESWYMECIQPWLVIFLILLLIPGCMILSQLDWARIFRQVQFWYWY